VSAPADHATVDGCLRLGAGFAQRDRAWVVDQLAPLDTRLASFLAERTDLELSVKDREAKGQKVTLECQVAGLPAIVTTSTEERLHDALNDVRDDLRRKLNDAKGRMESSRHRPAPPAGQAPAPDGDLPD
jgi:ribosome-associated translation inhibitor RaiA